MEIENVKLEHLNNTWSKVFCPGKQQKKLSPFEQYLNKRIKKNAIQRGEIEKGK